MDNLEQVLVTALNDVDDKVHADYMADSYVEDVIAACERLRGVMDLLRHKLDGNAVH